MVTVDTSAGIVTLVSRTHRLTSRDVQEGAAAESGHADGLVTDEYGRPLDLSYGFVCRARGIQEVHEDDFIVALKQSLQAYCRFLADEDRPVEQSRPFQMRTLTSYVTASTVPSPPTSVERPQRIPPEGPPPARPPLDDVYVAERPPPRRMIVKAVAVLGIAAAIALVAVFGFGGEGPVAAVTAEAEPTNVEVDCSQPVPITVLVPIIVPIIVHAHITTNDGATVSWTAGIEGKQLAKQADLTFDRAGTSNIDLLVLDVSSVRDLKSRGGVIKRSYKVIIDEPNKKEDNAEYTLRCKR